MSTLSESAVIAFREMCVNACIYLKETHGRAESETARKIISQASRCIGTDMVVNLNRVYTRKSFERGARRYAANS